MGLINESQLSNLSVNVVSLSDNIYKEFLRGNYYLRKSRSVGEKQLKRSENIKKQVLNCNNNHDNKSKQHESLESIP